MGRVRSVAVVCVDSRLCSLRAEDLLLSPSSGNTWMNAGHALMSFLAIVAVMKQYEVEGSGKLSVQRF